MSTQTSKTKKKPTALDKLIKTEWDALKDLKKMLKNPELSPAERTRAANALAYHASVLNGLLKQKGEEPRFNESTLGDYIKDIKMHTRAKSFTIRSFKLWTKKASSKK